MTRPVRVNSDVCAAWGTILKHAPNSSLIFDHEAYKDSLVKKHLLDNLVKAGAKEKQIIFRNTRPYWDVFTDIDLALDPWPAGSGTVGTDALWMHRITLTLKSRPIMGRWMTSQLTAVGLENFCHDTIEEYINAAVHYATAKEKRIELIKASTGLREKMNNSVLGDYKLYADEVINLCEKHGKKCDIEQARMNEGSR